MLFEKAGAALKSCDLPMPVPGPRQAEDSPAGGVGIGVGQPALDGPPQGRQAEQRRCHGDDDEYRNHESSSNWSSSFATRSWSRW